MLIVVFMISFLLIFNFIYSQNRKESKKEKISLFMVILITTLFSLIITATMALFLFILLGSTSIVTILFSLHIGKNQLVILAISFFVYLFIFANFIEFPVKYIIGSSIYYVLVLALIRISIFYLIGNAVGLSQTVSITIATGVTFITVLIEVLYHLKQKNNRK